MVTEAIFIPALKTDDAKDLVHQFLMNILSKHGFPINITSDRGVVFVSIFWQGLFQALGVCLAAFHLQADRQTERVISD